jgi:uncharacterized membrane protein
MSNRLKNYGLWVSVFAFIPVLLEAFGVNVLPDNYDEVVKGFLGILVVAGILSNPQTKNHGFLDDKGEEINSPQPIEENDKGQDEEENDA